MLELFQKLFDTSDFPPRWNCGNWDAPLGWLHIISDLLIFAAYTGIPITLFIFNWQKHRETLHGSLAMLFAAFILLCGLVHFVEVTLFWHPWYRLSGLVKAITAVFSVMTLVAVVRHMPEALRLPGIVTLNRRLENSLLEANRVSTELARSNEDLDQFAYVASHDLRAPLRGIRHLATWISEDCENILPEKSRRHLEQLQERADRLDTLLRDLLTYSRAGRDENEPESVDLPTMARNLFADYAPESDRFSLLFEPEEFPPLMMERIPFEQILRNLLGNAIKHHDRERGTIRISAKADPGEEEMIISIADDGPGIAPEFHEKVFGMFQTLRPKDEVEASGMGLALVQKLVLRLGGRIVLESAGSRGTTFHIFFPNRHTSS